MFVGKDDNVCSYDVLACIRECVGAQMLNKCAHACELGEKFGCIFKNNKTIRLIMRETQS